MGKRFFSTITWLKIRRSIATSLYTESLVDVLTASIPANIMLLYRKNCIQSIQCCISRRSKTAKIKCYKL